jgi:hypothetical protein
VASVRQPAGWPDVSAGIAVEQYFIAIFGDGVIKREGAPFTAD